MDDNNIKMNRIFSPYAIALYTVGANWVWPLLAYPQVSNAYVLGYTGLNILCLYICLGILALFSIPIAYLYASSSNRESWLLKMLTLALTGAVIRIMGVFGPEDSGVYWLFALGHVVITLAGIGILIPAIEYFNSSREG
jgi:hypothetical protein